MQSTLVKRQRRKLGPKVYTENGENYRITATVRHDDECGNGHNSFSVTGEIERKQGRRWLEDSGGCIHDEIARHFPEIAHLIKWHLCSTNGPLHYVDNTVYLAGDRDHNGGREGEPMWSDFYVRPESGGLLVEWPEEGQNPILGPKVQAFKTRQAAQDVADAHGRAKVVEFVTRWHDGKERQLDAARCSAVWPDATDEELTAPGLKERLEERLPALLADFRADVEAFGLEW